MKFKKLVAAGLAGAIGVATLAGCSAGETNYLKALVDMNSWTKVLSSGTTTVSINAEQFANMYNTLMLESSGGVVVDNTVNGVSVGTVTVTDGENSTSYKTLTAKDIPFENLTLDYEIEADVVGEYFFDMDITVDENKYPIEFYINEKDVTITKETLESAKDCIDKMGYADTMGDVLVDYLISATGDKDSVTISLTDDMALYGGIDSEDSKKLAECGVKMLNIFVDFTSEAFDGYETSLFAIANPSGASYDINFEKHVKALKDLAVYYSENSTKVSKAWDAMITELSEVYITYYDVMFGDYSDGLTPESIKNLFIQEFASENVLPSVNDTKELITILGTGLNLNTKENSPLKDVLRNSKLTGSITSPSSGVYVEKQDLVIPYLGVNALTISSKNEYKAVDSLTARNYDSAVISDVTKGYEDYLNDIHPATKATIIWDKVDSSYAELSIERQGVSTKYPNIEMVSLVNVDDYIYVPMRKLAEGLGYEVEWDTENSKAYAIDGDNKVDMTGMIVNDTTFIKVRDFEKLGIVVDYAEQADSSAYGDVTCTATLTKVVVPK